MLHSAILLRVWNSSGPSSFVYLFKQNCSTLVNALCISGEMQMSPVPRHPFVAREMQVLITNLSNFFSLTISWKNPFKFLS